MGTRRKKSVYVVFDESYMCHIKGVFNTEKKVQQYLEGIKEYLADHMPSHCTVSIREDEEHAFHHRYFCIEAECLSYGFHIEKSEVRGSEDINKKDINSVWAVTNNVEHWTSYLFMNKEDAMQWAESVKGMINGEEVFLAEYKVG